MTISVRCFFKHNSCMILGLVFSLKALTDLQLLYIQESKWFEIFTRFLHYKKYSCKQSILTTDDCTNESYSFFLFSFLRLKVVWVVNIILYLKCITFLRFSNFVILLPNKIQVVNNKIIQKTRAHLVGT